MQRFRIQAEKCDAEIGVCETCPSATPYWNDTKCVSCLDNSHCSGNTPVCNASNTCEACPAESPKWNVEKGVCEVDKVCKYVATKTFARGGFLIDNSPTMSL